MYPFISSGKDGESYLVENKITTLIGNYKYSVRDFNDFTEIQEKGELDINKTIKSDNTNKGELIRFILANEFLDSNENTISMALKANIDFYPFQIRPLLKFNTMAKKRLLIADETGLGKTIEAGMIIAETIASNPDGTIIILSPASVVSKWIKELRRKFGVRANVGNLNDFDGHKPPIGVFVISHGSMKEKDHVRIRKNALKLLVIDEIHLFIGRDQKQKRRKRAMCLSKSAEGVIGLSATPIQIEINDLQKILQLIAPEEHSPSKFMEEVEVQIAINKIILAQSKMENPDKKSLNIVENLFTNDEDLKFNNLREPIERSQWEKYSYLLQSLGPIGKRITRARARDPDINLAKKRIIFDHLVDMEAYEGIITEIDRQLIQMKKRFSNRQQLASCPSAAIRIISSIIDKENPNDGSDWDDGYIQENTLGVQNLKRLIQKTERIMPNIGPKMEKLMEIINRLSIREDITKVVVFTHWRPTLIHASKILLKNIKYSVHTIYPLDNYDEIEKKIERFRSEQDFSVLFVTDKMGIGIDLEMANVCINMDLPWNPAVLQQRIGRLDRIIQKSNFIEIHNLILKDSLEERIKEVIEKRLEYFKSVMGGMEPIIQVDEEDVIKEPDSEDKVIQEIGEIRKNIDVESIAKSYILLRVIDTSFDSKIQHIREELHPLYSLKYLIIKNAMERLGAKSRWEEDEGVIYLKMDDELRKGLMSSKSFFPWGPEEVYAAFESKNANNEVMIPMKGRKSILGPLHPFQKACTNLLTELEGIEIRSPTNLSDYYLSGNSNDDIRWKHGDSEKLVCDINKLRSEIEKGDKRFNWSFIENNKRREVFLELI